MKKITHLFSLLAASMLAVTASAQAPKYVLLEEFTGMNCPPCAAQNPGFLATILSPNPIVVHHIAYHPSWPGVDMMYTYNKKPVDSMVYQYAVSGVPDCIMLGNQKHAGPANYKQSDIDNEFSMGSPIKVSVTDAPTGGNNHTLTVVVTTVGTVPAGNYRLRTVICENLSFAAAPGTNGEKDFPNVFRKMIPNQAGDNITLASVGNSVQFTYNYTADTLWKMNNVKITSYVQNKGTGEVLNCGAVGDPAINYTLGAPAVTVQHGANAALNTFNLTSLNTGTASEQFSYTLTSNAPGDWTANFTFGGTPYTGSATITTPASSTNNIVINVTPGTSSFVGKYTLKVQSVTNPGLPPMTTNVYVIANVSDLIVNNSGNVGDGSAGSAANWDSVYTTGLAYSNRLTVGRTDEQVMSNAISQSAFAGVKNVYLNIGWTFPAFTDKEVAALTTFLNAGGNLLVSGQDVGWDTWGAAPAAGTANTKAFYTNFLNAAFSNDGTSANTQLTPIPSDPIWGTMPSATVANVYGGSPANFFPDELTVAGIGQAIYHYNGTTKVAGVRATNGTWKTVYLGPGIEMLGTAMDRRLVIKRAHDWFYGLVAAGINEQGSLSTMLGQNFPNPGNASTQIPLSNIEKDLVLQVVDLSGRVVSSVQVNKGTQMLSLSTADLSSGLYLYRLTDGHITLASRPMEVSH
jgi:hypothetical protein